MIGCAVCCLWHEQTWLPNSNIGLRSRRLCSCLAEFWTAWSEFPIHGLGKNGFMLVHSRFLQCWLGSVATKSCAVWCAYLCIRGGESGTNFVRIGSCNIQIKYVSTIPRLIEICFISFWNALIGSCACNRQLSFVRPINLVSRLCATRKHLVCIWHDQAQLVTFRDGFYPS